MTRHAIPIGWLALILVIAAAIVGVAILFIVFRGTARISDRLPQPRVADKLEPIDDDGEFCAPEGAMPIGRLR